MDSDFEVLYMDRKTMTRPFQSYWSHQHIRLESFVIVETIQSLETVSVLRHRIGPLGLVPSLVH
jgi:hypothetical protein